MPDRTVRELLLAKVDELAKVATLLAEIRAVTEHSSRNGPLVPERSHDGRRNGRRDQVAGPHPTARRAPTVRRMQPRLLG